MIKSKEIKVWIWNPTNKKIPLDLEKCRVDMVKVKATIQNIVKNTVVFTYLHPRLKKRVSSLCSLSYWNGY